VLKNSKRKERREMKQESWAIFCWCPSTFTVYFSKTLIATCHWGRVSIDLNPSRVQYRTYCCTVYENFADHFKSLVTWGLDLQSTHCRCSFSYG
jgi:hypothetical protein